MQHGLVGQHILLQEIILGMIQKVFIVNLLRNG